MERFVHNENLLHLRKQLLQSTDQSQRQQIMKLIAEESGNFQSVVTLSNVHIGASLA